MTRERGLTLAEIALAVGILLVAILTVVAALMGALKLNTKSTEVTIATEIARDFLERVKVDGYDKIPDGHFSFDGRSGDTARRGFPPSPYPRVEESKREFVLKVQVGTKGATLKTVTVEVFWDEFSRVILETYVYPGSVSYS